VIRRLPSGGLRPEVLSWLGEREREGVLVPVDWALAQSLLRHSGPLPDRAREVLAFSSVLASAASRDGDALLDLGPSGRSPFFETLPEDVPPPSGWPAILREITAVVGEEGRLAPLILDRDSLYLCRYYLAEIRVAEALFRRIAADRTIIPGNSPDAEKAIEIIDRLFPPSDGPSGLQEGSREAALSSLSRSFLILTGGPGTGKTWTASRIMALHRELFPALRIVAAAPTGKAAARMGQALATSGFAGAPPPTMTLHRLLESGSRGFSRNRDRPLDWDFVLVDELSMVDLPLMDRLLDALPDRSRLLVTGDQNQLVSVGAGSVMSDLCSALSSRPREDPARGTLQVLTHNFRQSEAGILRDFSGAVGEGSPVRALEILDRSQREGSGGKLLWIFPESGGADNPSLPLDRLVSHWLPFCQAGSAHAGLQSVDAFMILAAKREGPAGTRKINAQVHARIRRRLSPDSRLSPVMVLENSYETGLMNGDLGVLNRETLVFGTAQSLFTIKERLAPEWEFAYAMTVHKSQGSEFDHVLLLLGSADHPLLTRSLLYTAATRARKKLTIWGTREILERMISRETERSSALGDRLSRALGKALNERPP